MKLFEDMQETGGSIRDVIQTIVNDMFKEELDDDIIDEIVNNLSLSDMIALDTAYSDGNKEAVGDIIGPVTEYNMGGGRQATSTAAERPAPGRRDAPAANKKPGTQNTTQTNRNYSGGVQNGVTTQNVDSEDDPEQVMQDPEAPVEESMTDFDDAHYQELANWIDEYAYENGIAYGHEDQSSYDVADEFAELGIDTKEEAIEWLKNENRYTDQGEDPTARGYRDESVNRIAELAGVPMKEGGFAIGDAIIDDQGRTGEIYRSAVKDGQIEVAFYNGDGTEWVDLERIEINDYADSDEEEHDMRLSMGDDEYDRMHGDLGYNDDDEMYEGTGEQWNSDEVRRALEDIAMDVEPDSPEEAAALQMMAHRIHQSFPDSIDMSDMFDMLREPQLRALRPEDLKYALQASGFLDFTEEVAEDHMDKAGAESIIRDMADRYQAAMAGMSDEDEWEILSQAEELAKEYGVDLDMYFESRESKVIKMQEWIKRRAGIA